MKLGVANHNGNVFACLVQDDMVVDLAIAGYDSRRPDPLKQLLSEGLDLDRIHASLRSEIAPFTTATSQVRMLAPIARPPKIIGAGLNYRDPVQTVSTQRPDRPVLFTKFPSSVIGPDDVVRLPETDGLDADWEVELAVVIGSVVHPGEPGDLSAVFGYTIANDITSRYFAGAERQFLRAKSCDGFCPLGPVIVTRDEIPDPQNLQLRLFLNRERQQDGNSANMIFGVVELIQAISETVTLEPGDIILTGTPPGTGMEKTPQRYLRPGDVVLCEIAGIGVLSNLIVNHAGRAK